MNRRRALSQNNDNNLTKRQQKARLNRQHTKESAEGMNKMI
jgi:hypothetical protein